MALRRHKYTKFDIVFLGLSALIGVLFVADLTGYTFLYNGDWSSASFLLSALPQSLAALFAITFSILIIAIEFFASKYSPRVLKFSLEALFKDFEIVGVIAFFVATIFLNFVTLSHISGTNISNEIRILISLNVALTAYCFLLIINLFRHVPRFFNPESAIEYLTRIIKQENRFEENQEHVKILGDIVKKETVQGNIDIANAASKKLEEVALYNFTNERDGLNEEILEQLYDISRVAIRIDEVSMAIEVAQVMSFICITTVDEDSKYLAGFRYLRDIGILALDFSRGKVYTQLLFKVSEIFKVLILYTKKKDKSVQAIFTIMQFFILGSFFNANHESIATHIMEDIASVCSQREVEVAYKGLITKKETFKAYFGGKDPASAFSEFYTCMMPD